MYTVKIFFNDIETLCTIVKGNLLSENYHLNQLPCQCLKNKQQNKLAHHILAPRKRVICFNRKQFLQILT